MMSRGRTTDGSSNATERSEPDAPPCARHPASRRPPLRQSLVILALAAACGCGHLAIPIAVGGSALAGRVLASPPHFGSPERLLLADAGLDLLGSEVRVAAVGAFVVPLGGEAGFIDSGWGEGLAFAYRSASGGSPDGDMYVEWALERSAHKESASGLPAEYWRGTGGMRWSFAWGRMTEVFLSFGGGYHEIEVSGGRELSGPAAYGGGGIELLLGRAASAFLTAKLNYIWTDDPGYTATLAAGVGLRL